MGETDRSAAGPAAGYHYQAQRALLTLLNEPVGSGRELAMETLDDLAISDHESMVDLEQLKHSIRKSALTDRSPALWSALENWMDFLGTTRFAQIRQLVLVATDDVPTDSAPARLREDRRKPQEAEARLLAVAQERPGNKDTKAARERFAALSKRDRGTLLSKIIVRDGTAGVTEFRPQLEQALGLALPRAGVDEFLDQLVGWWEKRVVDLLVGRLKSVSYDEVAEEVGRLRDMYNDAALPPPDPALKGSLSDALAAAYAQAPFVHQLQFLALHDERVRLAIRDYHRAYAQRSNWLQEGILVTDELLEWEQRLIEEWERAWVRMLESVNEDDDEGAVSAGRVLLSELEDSTLNPLRSGRDRFLHIGTLHGLADARHVGWHREFEARLEAVFGPKRPLAQTSSTFEEIGGSA
jgi:hypothetical protein